MPPPPPPEHMDSIDEACKVSQAQGVINGALFFVKLSIREWVLIIKGLLGDPKP